MAYIDGDKFSYTDATATTFTGIPSSGELSVVGHADNIVVSAMNRHKPFYKIKGYRQNTLPGTVTLEGSTITQGTDYNLDFKPVSSSYWAQDLSWYSTLESTTSDVGGNLTNQGASFVTGKYGNGLEFNTDGDNAIFTATAGTDIDYVKGALEFWFRPYTPNAESVERTYFDITDGTDQFRFRKTTENILEFLIDEGATTYTESVTNSYYVWEAYDWIHIRLEWDDAAGATADEMIIYINGTKPTSTDASGFTGTSVTPGTTFNLGNNGDAGTVECNCIIDEFNIYDFNGSGGTATLAKLAEGGDTADADEYLFDSTNDYTFSFAEKDSSERGEYLYFGSDAQYSGTNIDLATLGAGSNLDLNWEYWNGTGWGDLESVSGFTDGTSNLTADGAVYWSAIPTNWRQYSVNGSPDLYYTRASLDYDVSLTREYTTSPIEDTIKTDILLLQYLSNISANDQTLVVPEFAGLAIPALLIVSWSFKRRRWIN
ncbi:hypothetical protein A2W15_00450 [Candidatus Woesebacteria bacterium RBG_16_41_13]|nr:MAG: hypothetical protein A2W15_00450 [Candidatus Woesebacteria bacterium RBG_16_41_13]